MGRKPKARRDEYGAWLFHLRQESDLTQEEMARQIGVPRSTLAYWERTGNLTGRKIILKMADVLGVSVNKLLRAGKADPQK